MTTALTQKTVAIIGGAGFIGHNLALELVRRHVKVAIVDSLQVNNLLAFASGNEDPLNRELNLRIINQRLDLLRTAGVTVHPQDARDYHALSRMLDEIRPNIVVHLAAVAHASRSNKDPYSTFDHSLRTLENALDFAKQKVEQFVFLSSSMAYGNFLTSEVDEQHPLNPIGIYGALKVAGEKIVIAYQQVFGLPFTIIRPSALYGPRCVSRRVSQIFIEAALAGKPLRVVGDGSERLDFTYIEDLVSGLCLTLGNPAAYNQIFNLTFGRSRAIAEMIEIIRRYFPNAVVQYVERDKLMPSRGTMSNRKAREMLGYEPKNPIDVGMPKYIEWYKELVDRSATVGV